MRTIFAAAFISLSAVSTASAEQVWLTMDQVRPYVLQKPATEIVVGNPAIADVTVQDKTRVLLFGKAPGVTNMYIFDEKGETIDNLVIRVKTTTNDMLTMHRGPLRTTYNCTQQCEETVTVGDNAATFTAVSQQVQQKLQQATTGGEN
jgi:Flp pilus assembly secretin CpaC